ncbi:nucleoside ABC transporter membrane protein [Hydrogenoanaerobacterium saccharovorans]|uniref:Nucleoside ABC transporter membrane protein n=1 Tax=Hydrogenoanaerobacterium saccharovorans TaxID=474960 RepID=A0A1H8AER4_9FIRM|nr:ABC transporter permease [Hydrogenoanaerobacterium saccharovorans]RPF48041.1 nucleoside ABC transporter membrane protein [Hydrogenoanaerobacterium saccharovorans]SEM68027.1 nucleoside ABC transporter membrane protein [Hydrogenoanaerobacterium saccharovorans]
MDFLNGTGLFLQTAVQMGTPLLFGTLGGILCEKVGHLNLGVEGMMLLGAVMGFLTALKTGNPLLAVIVSGLAGVAGALIYAVITVTFRGNQTVTGLVLTIFGTGISSFIGQNLAGLSLPEGLLAALGIHNIPGLSAIPVIGTALFKQSIYVHIGWISAVVIYIYLRKTRMGLSMRVVGENPAAADASGINITLYKYIHILLGGFLCGLGGSYLSLVFVPRWQDEITAGMGWIAIALVIFSTWNPAKAIFGAYLFGALRGVALKMQNVPLRLFGNNITIDSALLDMLPYIMTIAVLVFITLRKKKENQAPAWLGNAYFREDR